MEVSTLTYNLGNLGFWMCSTGWFKQNCFRSHCSPIVHSHLHWGLVPFGQEKTVSQNYTVPLISFWGILNLCFWVSRITDLRWIFCLKNCSKFLLTKIVNIFSLFFFIRPNISLFHTITFPSNIFHLFFSKILPPYLRLFLFFAPNVFFRKTFLLLSIWK